MINKPLYVLTTTPQYMDIPGLTKLCTSQVEDTGGPTCKKMS